ncbi:MAG: metallophosphoesterase, partial [Gemmobacter sp.]|nr:metallophosphoesterase [Gemmobacter sp.]
MPLTVPPCVCNLRILATSDLHAHVVPHDYYTDRSAEGVGLAHTARLIEILRGSATNSILLDNGDFLQGSAMGDYAAEAGVNPHPIIAAMNYLDYDVVALGNHELNYGLPFLRQALAAAQFPVVSANLMTADGQATLFAREALLDRVLRDQDGRDWPIRIGVIGFLPPQVVAWDRLHLADKATATGIVEAARGLVPVLRAAGADVVIALCHSGIGDGSDDPDSEDAGLALARVPGIDAMITGHTHQVFPGPDFADQPLADCVKGQLAGIPACMPGSAGSHVGVIDLALRRTAGGWQVESGTARAAPVTEASYLPPCPGILRLMDVHHRGTRAHLSRTVGLIERP